MQSRNFSPGRKGWHVADEVATAMREQHLAWEREQYDVRMVFGQCKVRWSGEPVDKPAHLLSNCRNCGAPGEPVCSYCGTKA